MKEMIKQTRQALDYKCTQPALAMCFALIEMCAKVEWPDDLDKNGNVKFSNYQKWYNQYILKKENEEADKFCNGKSLLRYNGFKLTGKEVYKLRCYFLHGGDVPSMSKGGTLNSFTFRLSDGEMTSSIGRAYTKKETHSHIRLSITDFCNIILDYVERYYDSHDKKLFEQFGKSIVMPINNFSQIP